MAVPTASRCVCGGRAGGEAFLSAVSAVSAVCRAVWQAFLRRFGLAACFRSPSKSSAATPPRSPVTERAVRGMDSAFHLATMEVIGASGTMEH
jgi:hypothetical protein